jgi:hypothetical protein
MVKRIEDLMIGHWYKIIEKNLNTKEIIVYYAKYSENLSYFCLFDTGNGDKQPKAFMFVNFKDNQVLNEGEWCAKHLNPDLYPEYYV